MRFYWNVVSPILFTETDCGDFDTQLHNCDRNHRDHNPKIFTIILLKAQSSGGVVGMLQGAATG